MAIIVGFNADGRGGGRIQSAVSPSVYMKTVWADDWVFQPDLWPTEVSWPVAPSLPTATLHWDFGWLRTPSAVSYFHRLRREGQLRLFVKIVCPTLDTDFDDADVFLSRDWYGVVDLSAEDIGGVFTFISDNEAAEPTVTPVSTGRQSLSAYGLEKVLADHVLTEAHFIHNAAGILVGDIVSTQPALPAFNADGRPNRSADAYPTGSRGFKSYVFSSDPTTSTFWSSANIVEYLLHRAAPRDRAGDIRLPFGATIATTLTTWDHPVVEQEGQTVASLLGRLLDRRRLWLWWLEVVDLVGRETAMLKVATLTTADIPIALAGASAFPGNTSAIALRFDFDQGTTASVKRSGVDRVDQVIARGARRRSVFSVSIKDTTLGSGWGSGLTDEYNEGASNSTGYAAAGVKDKQKKNAEVRAQPKLDEVFSLYALPNPGFAFVVGDGLGGLLTLATQWAVFPHDSETRDDDARPEVVPAHFGSTFVEQTLPLLAGVDYSGGKIEAGTVDETTATDNLAELKPFVLFRVPETAGLATSEQRWARADAIGENAGLEITEADENAKWSASIEVPDRSHAIKIKVHGAPQHIIDNEAGFDPLEDGGLRVDPDLGAWDIREGAIITMSLPDPRFVEAAYPAEVAADRDYVRRKVIEAGEDFKQIYVVPQTVVGVDDAGNLLRSDGGFLPYAGGDADADDVARLAVVARLAAEWYTTDRFVLTVNSVMLRAANNAADAPADFLDGIDRGVFVESVGSEFEDFPTFDNYEVVNSPITSIAFSYPIDGEPAMLVQTWAGELDALQYAPLPVGLTTPLPPADGGPAGRLGPGVSDTPF